MNATLEAFLKFGFLGPLYLDMPASELLFRLGPPDGSSLSKKPTILKYGGLQVTITRGGEPPQDRVARIGIYFVPTNEPLPESLIPSDWLPDADTGEAEVQNFLQNNNLSAQRLVNHEVVRFILTSGATITFADGKIVNIEITLRDRKASKVTVPLSDKVIDVLRECATESNRSIEQICADWLAEKAETIHSLS